MSVQLSNSMTDGQECPSYIAVRQLLPLACPLAQEKLPHPCCRRHGIGADAAAAVQYDGGLSPFPTPWRVIAGGPGGAYRTSDATTWEEFSLWREQETGAADFLHAYWMGRFYGFLAAE